MSSATAFSSEPIRASKGFLATLREWFDALIIAFMLAMFIRLFVAELFKIPSASMTPTLLGTQADQGVSFYDVNKDGVEDMLLWRQGNTGEWQLPDVYLRKGDHYEYAGIADGTLPKIAAADMEQRQDRILVAKFFYWFAPPKRGDIVVFKVPETIFETNKPIYIKRAVGLPGETLTFEPTDGVRGHMNTMAHLVVDGKRAETPDFFQRQRYEFCDPRGFEYRSVLRGYMEPFQHPITATYKNWGASGAEISKIKVPDDSIYVFGDNTVSSMDSRYWGAVELARLRGKAIFRYYKNPSFLK
ncbi:TPA: signal peptidase I [Candidatus Sumerlaeota bacterium]|nr:signal peptidase I [Candidatus Sumerlaeota bacterium]